ncbi:hypothetical protein K7I13_04525 [Brucepastera parasyntrophica]|uniref:hypothetical protein n=1 Tax=Brucepastera parasyntrophica TaxID=2880008 RepID=UPI00210956BD|nr:hypothetical protein [Brucepastera parasyntrophica]ULQ60560.1 hypothetical protein K7I13_04525 [Brucepastera parasyntrophica]
MNTIVYGNNFFVWNGFWESDQGGGDVLADYATVYLFFQWLRIHSGLDTGIYKKIIDSDYRDYRAVTESAGAYIDSSFGNWEKLLSYWMMSNYFNNTSGYLGYNNEIRTRIRYPANLSQKRYVLSPGEGFFSYLGSKSFNRDSESGTNIRYRSFSSDSATIIAAAPYSGDTLLAFNANSNKSGSDEYGYAANTSGAIRTQSRQLTVISDSVPDMYPVSVHPAGGGGLDADSHRIQRPSGIERKAGVRR